MDILQQFPFHFELRNCPIQYILKTQILSFYFVQMMVKCMEKTGQYTIMFEKQEDCNERLKWTVSPREIF